LGFRAQSYASFFPIVIGALALSGFIAIRPAIISFLFFFCFAEILAHAYGRINFHRNAILFATVVFLVWLWANLHAGFITGIIMLCLTIFFSHLYYYWNHKKLLGKH